jgi:hypothetical protein
MTTPQFTTRPDRLWADTNLDLSADRSYKIDNVPVLSTKELGLTVTKSNLRQIGTLNSLEVSGDTTLADFAYFNSTYNRLGLGTTEPNGSIGIVDNNVEIVIGSPEYGQANVGTYSNSDLNLITDNIARITIKSGGEVHIGDSVGKTGKLVVHGSLHVEEFTSDTRIERTSSLEFKSTRESGLYGVGLLWRGDDYIREFVLKNNPERLFSTSSIDVDQGKGYFINGKLALASNALGDDIVKSNLIKVGPLQDLTVNGPTLLQGNLDIKGGNITAKGIVLNNGQRNISIEADGINASQSIDISIQGRRAFYADTSELVLGNSSDSTRPVKVFGTLSVGINQVDTSLGLDVRGVVRLDGKKFIQGTSIPATGQYNKGDICWNRNPQASSYVGWICTVSGTPGEWLPFGAINRQ